MPRAETISSSDRWRSGGVRMGAFRRALRACAAAGLATAAGCAAPDVPHDADTALARRGPRLPAPGIPSPPAAIAAGTGPLAYAAPPREPTDAALPINLATALQLGNARPLDVQIAGRQVAAAAAAYDRARLLWVPNLVLGVDYFAHTGLQQNFAG